MYEVVAAPAEASSRSRGDRMDRNFDDSSSSLVSEPVDTLATGCSAFSCRTVLGLFSSVAGTPGLVANMLVCALDDVSPAVADFVDCTVVDSSSLVTELGVGVDVLSVFGSDFSSK